MARILYLEDEENLVDLLPDILKTKNFDVTATMSIEKALEQLAHENFDAVLLDIMMEPADNMNAEELDYGRKTGIEVARRMKALKPNVPIVAFTVITDPKIVGEMKQAGIMNIVNKPAEIEQIVNALLQAVKTNN